MISAQFAVRRTWTGCQTILAYDKELTARTRSLTELRIAFAVFRPIDFALFIARLRIATNSPSTFGTENICHNVWAFRGSRCDWAGIILVYPDLLDGSDTGAKNWPLGQDALVNIGWHRASLGDCAVPGGHLHSAIVPPPPAAGPSSIVSGHGAPICNERTIVRCHLKYLRVI